MGYSEDRGTVKTKKGFRTPKLSDAQKRAKKLAKVFASKNPFIVTPTGPVPF
jgi:hypothetical protein